MSKLLSRLNEWRSSTVFITFTICYAVFVDQLFFAFLLPILPYSLPSRNGIAVERVQYWTTILVITYGIAIVISCPLIGWWTDRHTSRRVPWLLSLLFLLTSTLIMWLTKPIALQLLSRVLQGMTTTTVYIVGMTIIIDTVTTRHAAEYMGHVAMALNIGTFAGPLLGGVVFDRAGYHAVWWMMVGFVMLSALLRFVMVEKGARCKTYDLESDTSSIKSDTTLSESHTDEGTKPFQTDDGRVSPSSARAWVSTRPRPDAMSLSKKNGRLPALLTLTFSMRMIVALYGVCIQSVVFTGFETVLALYVQETFGYTSLGAGLMFIPLTLPSFFAPFLGRLIDRTKPRWALVTGFLGLCPVLVVTRFVTYNSIGQKVLLCALLFLIGLGITMALNPLMAEISYVAEEKRNNEKKNHQRASGGTDSGAFAQAYALFLMAFAVGNIVGPLVSGLIKDSQGWGTMCWVLGLLSGTTALPCFIWSGEGSESSFLSRRTAT